MPEGYYGSGFYDDESTRRLQEFRKRRNVQSEELMAMLAKAVQQGGGQISNVMSGAGPGIGAPPSEVATSSLLPKDSAAGRLVGSSVNTVMDFADPLLDKGSAFAKFLATPGAIPGALYEAAKPAVNLFRSDAAIEAERAKELEAQRPAPQYGPVEPEHPYVTPGMNPPEATRGIVPSMLDPNWEQKYPDGAPLKSDIGSLKRLEDEPEMTDEEKLRKLRAHVDMAEGLGSMGNYRSAEEIRLGEAPRQPFVAETSRRNAADQEKDMERKKELDAAMTLQEPKLAAARETAMLRQLGTQRNADRDFALKQQQVGRPSDEVQKELSGRRSTFEAISQVRQRFDDTDSGWYKTRLNRALKTVGADDPQLTALDSELNQLFAKWMYAIGGKQLAVQELQLFKGAFADAAQKEGTALELLDSFERQLKSDTANRLKDLEASHYDVSPWADIGGDGQAAAKQFKIKTEDRGWIGPASAEQAQAAAADGLEVLEIQ